eukprot:5774101-Prymnesium_polylepis.1
MYGVDSFLRRGGDFGRILSRTAPPARRATASTALGRVLALGLHALHPMLWQDERRELATVAAARVEPGGVGVPLQPPLGVMAEDHVLGARPQRRPRLALVALLDGTPAALGARQQIAHACHVVGRLIAERHVRHEARVHHDRPLVRQSERVGQLSQEAHVVRAEAVRVRVLVEAVRRFAAPPLEVTLVPLAQRRVVVVAAHAVEALSPRKGHDRRGARALVDHCGGQQARVLPKGKTAEASRIGRGTHGRRRAPQRRPPACSRPWPAARAARGGSRGRRR